MFPSYTAVDLIRTMNQELIERHQNTAFAHHWGNGTADHSPKAKGLRGLVRRGRG